MTKNTKLVQRLHAPRGGRVRPPALLSVDRDENEDVEWIWTHPVDGHSFVSGYRVVPRLSGILTTGQERNDG
jgi:hypothetical protein